MRTQIKVIRFAAINSAIFAVFTYLITLNMEIGFLNLDTSWLSNNFALTICGGADLRSSKIDKEEYGETTKKRENLLEKLSIEITSICEYYCYNIITT